MAYGYEFEYGMPDVPQGLMMGVGGAVVAVLLIVLLLALAFSIVSYVLSAVGIYRIAKRRGIHHAWLAWVPVGNSWLLGSISDHYQYVVKHKMTKRRKVLLILNVILFAVSVLFSGSVLIGNLAAIGSGTATATNGSGAVWGIILMVLYYWLVLGLSIAVTVVAYIAYYDLFQSSKPGYAVLFLVLGVIFNVTLPFFVFACSSSDKGMPERRIPRPQEPYTAETPAEEIPVVEAEVISDDYLEE